MGSYNDFDYSFKLMDIVIKTIMVLMIIMMVGLCFLLADSITSQELGIKKVDCYDRERNVIIGLQCEEMDFCTHFGWFGGQKCSEVKK